MSQESHGKDDRTYMNETFKFNDISLRSTTDAIMTKEKSCRSRLIK